MKTSLPLRMLPFLAMPLLACSGGDDVYVRPEGSTGQNQSPSQCLIAPGEDVCANLAKYSAETLPASTIDTMRAVLDFGRVAMSSASSLMIACGGILDDLGIQRPQGSPSGASGSPQWLADVAKLYCETAATAIRVRGEGLELAIEPPVCTTTTDPKPACGSGAVVPRQECGDPKVTVDPGAGAAADRVALAKTLEKHLPKALRLKAELERLVSLTKKITGDVDSLATVDSTCVASFAQLAGHSVALTSSAATSAGQLLSAAQ